MAVQLSRRVEYALLALIDLAIEGREERVQLHDIAQRQAIPEKYLEQLLRPLKTSGVVISTRGSRGGYQLAREPREVTVLEVVEAVEGPLTPDDAPAAETVGGQVVRALWDGLHLEVSRYLGSIRLSELAQQYQTRRAAKEDWVI